MRILKRTLALTLVAAWLPVTMHCSLETLPGFDALDSCCDTAAATSTNDGCAQDQCPEIEAGHYRIEDNPQLAFTVAVACSIPNGIETALLPETPAPVFRCAGLSPPELSQTWQFSRRAALPARAPSLIS